MRQEYAQNVRPKHREFESRVCKALQQRYPQRFGTVFKLTSNPFDGLDAPLYDSAGKLIAILGIKGRDAAIEFAGDDDVPRLRTPKYGSYPDWKVDKKQLDYLFALGQKHKVPAFAVPVFFNNGKPSQLCLLNLIKNPPSASFKTGPFSRRDETHTDQAYLVPLNESPLKLVPDLHVEFPDNYFDEE